MLRKLPVLPAEKYILYTVQCTLILSMVKYTWIEGPKTPEFPLTMHMR